MNGSMPLTESSPERIQNASPPRNGTCSFRLGASTTGYRMSNMTVACGISTVRWPRGLTNRPLASSSLSRFCQAVFKDGAEASGEDVVGMVVEPLLVLRVRH